MKKRFLLIGFSLCLMVCIKAQTVIYVSPEASGKGTSWVDACSLDSAMILASASPGAQIWLQTGTYWPVQTIVIPSETQVYGGFSGHETTLQQRNYALNPTIIDAQSFCGVIHLSTQASLNGITIQNGLSNVPAQSSGGGVYMDSNSSIENCYILNNIALNYGGGIYAKGSGRVVNTVISGNKSGKDGAAIYGETLEITNSTITENEFMKCSDEPDTVYMTPVCAGDSVRLTVWSIGAFLWNTGEDQASIVTTPLTHDTTYVCIITLENPTCTYMQYFNIKVKPQPTLEVTTNKTIANIGEQCSFSVSGYPYGGTYLWNDSTTDTTFTKLMPTIGDLQYLCTYNLNGCVATDYATIVNTLCSPPTAPDSVTANRPVTCFDRIVTLSVHGGDRNSGIWALYSDSCGGEKLDSSNLSTGAAFQMKPPVGTETYYVRGEGCGTVTSCVSITVTVNPRPAPIIGGASLCANTSARYFNDSVGGVWSIRTWGAGSYFNVNSSTGDVTGLSRGFGILYYTLPTGCSSLRTIVVLSVPSPITGPTDICQNSPTTYSSTPNGGLWQWDPPTTIATVSPAGTVTGINTGNAVLTYKHPISRCTSSLAILVDSLPVHTVGPHEVCQYDSIQLTNATSGGTWHVEPSSNASISATGMLTGLLPGAAVVSYTVGHCSDTFHIQVNPGVPPVTVASRLCEGSVIHAMCELDSDSEPELGERWSILQTSIATVDPITGVITGLQAGSFDLTYRLPNNGCSKTLWPIFVDSIPAPISGQRYIGEGYNEQLTTASTNGTWISYNPEIAIVDPVTGLVTGVSSGTAIIRYQFVSGCMDTFSIQVNPCPSLTLMSNAGTDNQWSCYAGSGGLPFDDVVLLAKNASITSIIWDSSGIIFPQPSGLTYDTHTHTLSGKPTTPGRYDYTISTVDQNTGCPPAVFIGQVHILDSLHGGRIDTSQSVCYGSWIAGFTNTITGSGGESNSIAYQWEYSYDNVNFDAFISIGSNQLTYNEHRPLDVTTYYRRRYSNVCGTALSNVVKVTVNPLPPKPTGISDDDNHCDATPNGTITINVNANGYAYKVDNEPFVSRELSEGDITFENYMSGTYTMYVQDTATGCINSDTISVESDTVTPNISGFEILHDGVLTADDHLFCMRQSGSETFSITPIDDENTSENSPYSYSWNDGSTNKTLTGLVPDQDTTFTVTVTNSGGCISVAKKTFLLIRPIEVSITPSAQRHCVGDIMDPLSSAISVYDNITASEDIAYQWYSSPDSSEWDSGDWTAIPDAINSVYTPPNTIAGDVFYRVVVDPNNDVCNPTIGPIVRVTTISPPSIASVTPDTICGTGEVHLSATTSPPGLSVNWYSHILSDVVLKTTLSEEFFVIDTLTSSTTYWVEANNGLCVTPVHVPVTATVLTPHAIGQTSPNPTLHQTVCSGAFIDAISFIVGGGAYDGTLTWHPYPPTGITSSPFSIYGAPINRGHIDDSTFTWMIVTQGNSCKSDTVSGTILVNHLPGTIDINPLNTIACDSLVLTATGGEGGTIYYQNMANLGIATVNAKTSQTVMSNGTYYFRAVSSAGCWGLQSSRTVTIRRRPVIMVHPDALNYLSTPPLPKPIPTPTPPTPKPPFKPLYVMALGDELSYQWYSTTAPTLGAGQTTLLDNHSARNIYTPDNNNSAVGSALYFYCVVSGNAVCPADTSHISGLHQVTPNIARCNNEMPSWGDAGLGEISFISDSTWTIGSQTWSDAVTATKCKKTVYNNDAQPGTIYKADCRDNPNPSRITGDLFSWCAAVRFEHQLCPGDWRLPTREDFVALDRALGGNGSATGNMSPKYLSQWGGKTNGGCGPLGNIFYLNDRIYHWSSTPAANTTAYHLLVYVPGTSYPQNTSSKGYGLSIRCVK